MYELSGKIEQFSVDYGTKKGVLLLSINEMHDLINCYNELSQCDKVSVKIDKHREKRSLDANRYFWHLCGELAKHLSNEKVKYTKEDIYRKVIKESGVWADDEIEPEKVKWRCAAWGEIGTGWLTERVDFSQDGNKEIIRFYYGSSRYNSAQMSKLIDSIVQDCEAEGIPTKTPDEIANMLSLWGEGEKND